MRLRRWLAYAQILAVLWRRMANYEAQDSLFGMFLSSAQTSEESAEVDRQDGCLAADHVPRTCARSGVAETFNMAWWMHDQDDTHFVAVLLISAIQFSKI